MCCQEEIIDISRILRCYVICPHLTLADNRADCCVVILRGIFILFQKMFHHLPHTGTRCFFFLPIYRPIFAQHLCKFSGQVDQFIIPIKILDVLRLGQSIVKCQLFLRQPQFLTIIVQLRDLLCRFQKFLDTTKNADGKHKEKRLQNELKRLTRSERTHRLCTRAGMLETFLKEPTVLTDEDVMELLTFIFQSETVQKKLNLLIESRRETLTTDGSENPLF